MGIISKNKGRAVGEVAQLTVPVSFETGEVGANKVYFARNVVIQKITIQVTKALADTDAGTITGANATGNSTGGAISLAASTVTGTVATATPTTNNTVAAGSYYNLASAKTTAGGKGLVTIFYLKA